LTWEYRAFLAGSKHGIITRELKKILSHSNNPNAGWTLPIAEKFNLEDYSFIIDIKPNSKELFICELDRVFGFSYPNWTPIMLMLRRLTGPNMGADFSKTEFNFPINTSIVYTMLYLNGSFQDGKLTGKWTMPKGTVTALLLWPEALSYFVSQIKTYDESFLISGFDIVDTMSKDASR
jgi:hypothetical protein